MARKRSTAGDPEPTLEERIVQAARRCLERWGADKTSMDDVAGEAGVSRMTVYRAFGDKAKLITAVVVLEQELFLEQASEELDEQDTLEDQLATFAAIMARYEQRSPSQRTRDRLRISPERLAVIMTDHVEPVLRAVRDFLADYIEAAVQRGEVRSDVDVDEAAEWVARAFFAMKHFPSLSFKRDQPRSAAEFARRYIVRGLD